MVPNYFLLEETPFQKVEKQLIELYPLEVHLFPLKQCENQTKLMNEVIGLKPSL